LQFVNPFPQFGAPIFTLPTFSPIILNLFWISSPVLGLLRRLFVRPSFFRNGQAKPGTFQGFQLFLLCCRCLCAHFARIGVPETLPFPSGPWSNFSPFLFFFFPLMPYAVSHTIKFFPAQHSSTNSNIPKCNPFPRLTLTSRRF